MDKANAEIEKLKVQMQRVLSNLDESLKRSETDEQERLMLSRQVDRLDRWVRVIAAKNGIDLESIELENTKLESSKKR